MSTSNSPMISSNPRKREPFFRLLQIPLGIYPAASQCVLPNRGEEALCTRYDHKYLKRRNRNLVVCLRCTMVRYSISSDHLVACQDSARKWPQTRQPRSPYWKGREGKGRGNAGRLSCDHLAILTSFRGGPQTTLISC